MYVLPACKILEPIALNAENEFDSPLTWKYDETDAIGMLFINLIANLYILNN